MRPFEQEIKGYFAAHGIRYHDGSADFVRLDFGFGDPERKRYFTFDVKEKRQRYNLRNWPDAGIAEQHLFILDDLAARKVLMFAPNSGLLVRDNLQGCYYLFTVIDLYLMPKVRVNRAISRQQERQKGKWLIDLRNGRRCEDLEQVFAAIDAYLDQREALFKSELACYGAYEGESIGQGGVVRQPQHWRQDVEQTR